MAEKANKTTKNNNSKNTLLAICGIAVVVVVIIIAIVLATRGTGGLNESYFVSDNTKYVLTLGADDVSSEDADSAPIKTHLVYYYSGDAVTGMKGFYEFANEATAKAAYDYYNGNNNGAYKSVELNGKYVILTANEADYEGLTATEVKSQIDAIEQIKNNPSANTETVTEVEETTETEQTTE